MSWSILAPLRTLNVLVALLFGGRLALGVPVAQIKPQTCSISNCADHKTPEVQAKINACQMVVASNECRSLGPATKLRDCQSEAFCPSSLDQSYVAGCLVGSGNFVVDIAVSPVQLVAAAWEQTRSDAKYSNAYVFQGCKAADEKVAKPEVGADLDCEQNFWHAACPRTIVKKCKESLLEDFPDLKNSYGRKYDQVSYEKVWNDVHSRLTQIAQTQPSLKKFLQDHADHPFTALHQAVTSQLQKQGYKFECMSAKDVAAFSCDAVLQALSVVAGGSMAAAKAGSVAEAASAARATATTALRGGTRAAERLGWKAPAEYRLTPTDLNQLREKFPPERITEAQGAIDKMAQGETLSLEESRRAAEVFDSVKRRGIISFHKTNPNNLPLIQQSGYIKTAKDTPQVYALPTDNHNVLNAGKKLESGTVIFQGQAAQLTGNKGVVGLYSAWGNRAGHQVTKMGRLIIDESEMIDGALVIKRAHVQPLSPSELAKGKLVPALDSMSLPLWLGAGGTLYFMIPGN